MDFLLYFYLLPVGGFLLLTWLPGLCHRAISPLLLARRSRGKLVLSYDDGPGRVLEPRILEVLERHGAKATFFLRGQGAESLPEGCLALARAGQEIGCHAYAHLDPWRSLPRAVLEDLRKGFEILAPWLSPTRPFRPPFGRVTLWTWIQARRRGAGIWLWTHDSGDLSRSPPGVERVLASLRGSGGGVVLLHSNDRPPDRRNAEDYVVELTEALLQTARSEGWKVGPISMLESRPGR